MFIFAALESSPFKISIVNYTNTLPFKWAIKNSSLLQKIALEEDIPSICAQKLKFRQVDIALVPVALIPELDEYFIETDYCIGADGKVDSVKLYSEVPLEELKTVTLDYQSRTSIALVKVLFKFFWKLDVDFVDAKHGFEASIVNENAAVVIGDRTFAMNGNYLFEYDLAEEWKKFTGLPFVFAAWISTEKLPYEFINEFNGVLKNGVDQIEDAVKQDYNGADLKAEKIIEYLRHRISYSLDDEKRKALALFLSYLKQL